MRKIQLECLIFRKVNNSFEFLLLKRIPKKGGFWQPVCGGLEKEDNSKLEATYREVFEETGISKKDIIKVIENVYYFVIDSHYITGEPIEPIEEFVFAFQVPNDIKISIENNVYVEHEDYKWVSFEDAIKLLKWEGNKEALKALNELL